MKLLFSISAFFIFSQTLAQEASVMEKRARELHRVINSSDKQEWIKFIKENYTLAFIDKPMTAKVQTNDDGHVLSTKEELKDADKIEAKANMFARLHEDFSGSKITSIKPEGDKLEMVLNNGAGLTGTFTLRFEKTKPYLISGIGIEAGN